MRLGLAVALAALAVVSCGAAQRTQSVPKLSRVVVVVFENHEVDEIMGSRDAPTFNRLAGKYATLSNYTGVAHPSLPNYLALVSGSTHGIHDDCTSCTVGGLSLADTLERAGKSWKLYAEGLPHAGFTGGSRGRYAKKHSPFLHFRRVLARPSRVARVVPLGRLSRDLARGALPTFSLVVPDLCHDMHDCSVATGDKWLKQFAPRLLGSRSLRNGVVFVVFDEGTSNAGGGGRVAALALGPRVVPGSRDGDALSHYSLLRTIEDALRVPRLGRSASATAITGIWK